jgi:hypothetical protein
MTSIWLDIQNSSEPYNTPAAANTNGKIRCASQWKPFSAKMTAEQMFFIFGTPPKIQALLAAIKNM